MSNEIEYLHTATGATTLKAVIANASNQRWNTSGSPAFESYTVANVGNYAITMTETPASSYRYVASIPTGINTAGDLTVLVYDKSGTLTAADQPISKPLVIPWSGSAVVQSSALATAATQAAIKAKTDQLTFSTANVVDASGSVVAVVPSTTTVTAPVDPSQGNRLTLVQGDDHLTGDRLPTWAITDYAGPSLSGATAVLRLIRKDLYAKKGSDAAADLEVTATIAGTTTLAITAPITATQSAALDAKENDVPLYQYQVIVTTTNKVTTLVAGEVVVLRKIDAGA
jgi:hypothetical protein